MSRVHGPSTPAASAPDPQRVALFGGVAKAAAIATGAIGAIVLAAWLLDLPRVAALIEGGVTMKANTALAFVLAGAALLLVQLPAFANAGGGAAAAACAWAVGVIGAMSLAQSLFGWEFGIDQFLARGSGDAGTAHAGRNAMLEAGNFMLVATGLLLVDVEVAGRWRPAQFLALAALAVVSVPALGYAYSASGLPGVPAATRMALPTVLAFVALSLGLLTARPDRGFMALVASSGPGGRMARRLLPVTLLLPAIVGGLRLAGQRAGWYGTEFGVVLLVTVMALALTLMVWRYSMFLERVDRQRRRTDLQMGELVENAPDAMLMVDERGVMQMANAEAERLFGYARRELVGEAVELLVPEASRSAHVALRDAFMREPARRALGPGRELFGRRKDGSLVPVEITVSRADVGTGIWFMATVRDITARRHAETALKDIEWMLAKDAARRVLPVTAQPYGDLTILNTERTILDAVGKDLLHEIVSDYMGLLGTSSAVYEKNGDYAYGVFTSGWCQAMDQASRRGCGTADNRRALKCGKWHCHESCWNEASRVSMERREATDVACQGGIRLYAVPIVAGREIIGSINFGYGRPPQDEASLAPLAGKYGLTVAEMRRHAAAYRERPPFIVELAKQRLAGSARLIGEIVQRRRAETNLRASEAQLREAQRLAHVGSWALDLRTGALHWSDEIFRIFEIDPTRFGASYEAFLAAVHPDDRAAVNEAYAQSVATRTPYAIDHRLLMPDTRVKYVHERGETFYAEDGAPQRSVGTVQDVTEQKRAEQRAERANRALRMLYAVSEEVARARTADALLQRACDIAAGPGGYRMAWVGRADNTPDRRVQPVAHAGADGAYLATAGITWADEPRGRGPTGRAIREGAPQVARDVASDASLAPWREHALRQGYASSAALPLTVGTRAWGALNLYSERADAFDDDEMRVLAGMAGDLGYALEALATREKARRAAQALEKAQEELRRLNADLEERVRARTAELEAANKDLEGFSYSISHDLRAPLRAIDNFSAFLVQDHAAQLDAEGHRLLAVIRRNAAGMSQLIDDVLAFARASRDEVASEVVDIAALAADALAELTAGSASAAQVEIGALPPALGDARLLRQVFLNLVGNALKFAGGRAGAIVRVQGRVEDAEALYEVSDNGVGFDARFAHKLFGVFQRLHRSEFPGTGIGLAIVKRIVTRHGGRVWAEAHTGHPGATFGFSLRAAEAQRPDPVRAQPAGRPMAAKETP
jgi:PAS domain S-box-containing protein